MITEELINTRNITRFYAKEFHLPARIIELDYGNNFQNTNNGSLLVIEFLIKVYGDYNKLIEALEKRKNKELNKSIYLNDKYYSFFHQLMIIYATKYFTFELLDSNKEYSFEMLINDQYISKIDFTLKNSSVIKTIIYGTGKTGIIMENRILLYRSL